GVKVTGPPAKPARGRVEVNTDMVEHTVEQQPQTPSVRFGDEVVEVVIVAEPRIDPVVVGGVVTVGAGGEDRPQCNSRRTELDGVVEPIGDPSQPVFTRIRRRGRRESPHEPEWVDVPPDHMPDPRRHRHRRYLASYRDFTCASSSAAGPSATALGATVLTDSMATGGVGTCHSASHRVSCAHDVA